jgi:hypothetical protein
MSNKAIIAIIALTALLLASAAFNVKQITERKADKKRLDALAANTINGTAKIEYRYIHDSIEHVVTKEVEAKTAAEKSVAVGPGYLDTLTKALSVATKQVDEVTKVNASLLAENLQLKQSTGPNATKVMHYRDKYLALDYHPDSNRIDLNYDVSLNVAKYWKRRYLIGPKQYYIDIFSDDPRVQINAVKRYSMVAARQKRLGLGVNVAYSYNPFSNQWAPTIGLGLQYNILEF